MLPGTPVVATAISHIQRVNSFCVQLGSLCRNRVLGCQQALTVFHHPSAAMVKLCCQLSGGLATMAIALQSSEGMVEEMFTTDFHSTCSYIPAMFLCISWMSLSSPLLLRSFRSSENRGASTENALLYKQQRRLR